MTNLAEASVTEVLSVDLEHPLVQFKYDRDLSNI